MVQIGLTNNLPDAKTLAGAEVGYETFFLLAYPTIPGAYPHPAGRGCPDLYVFPTDKAEVHEVAQKSVSIPSNQVNVSCTSAPSGLSPRLLCRNPF